MTVHQCRFMGLSVVDGHVEGQRVVQVLQEAIGQLLTGQHEG